jgi:flagellar hook protein FlgE
MSLFGALYTAVSGLTAQAAAFGNISDNVANSQTVGFKGVNTAFSDYLTTSTAQVNQPGAAVATPVYQNDVQGSISQSSDPLALAISGAGLFAVNESDSATSAGDPIFSNLQYYTRAGDFSLNKEGYLVNSAGEYLDGWITDPNTGITDTTQLKTIQVNQGEFNPVATSAVDLSANLPATPSATTDTSSDIQVYDALGTAHTVTINWVQNTQNDWTATISCPDNVSGSTIGTAEVQFGPETSGNPVPEGTVGAFGAVSGTVTGAAYASDTEAALSFVADFGNGSQTISLNLGDFGTSTGVTQFAGTTYDLRNVSQNGVPAGSFTGISMQSSGNIVSNYDNGESITIAQIPLVTFNAPDALQRQNGQAFTQDQNTGNPTVQSAGSNEAGQLVTNSVESSNVDIATQFSQLIIAQQAYGANTKVVTTASTLLQETIDMKQ